MGVNQPIISPIILLKDPLGRGWLYFLTLVCFFFILAIGGGGGGAWRRGGVALECERTGIEYEAISYRLSLVCE